MKQLNSRRNREATAFLYERLSRDDNLEGESYSIGNQKALLIVVFAGYFKRAAYQQ